MDDLSVHLTKPILCDYTQKCAAVYQKLVHSNLSAHVVWEILEFHRLAGRVFRPPERDLLRVLLMNSADRIVLTVVALTERSSQTLNFGKLMKFLQKNARPASKPIIAKELAKVNLEERRKGLLGRATSARNQMIAHFSVEQALDAGKANRRLFFEEVLDLQDEAQDMFEILRVQPASYTSHTALTRQMLRLLAGAYGDRIKGMSGEVLQEMLAPRTILPGVSPWKLGRPRR